MWAESRRGTIGVAIECGQNHVGTLQVSHYKCRYQCGQNHVETLQVSLSMWAESCRDTTCLAVGTLQVSLSMWAESRRGTTGVAIKCGQNYDGALQVSLSM